MSGEFSHLDEGGAARMVDIADKPASQRAAVASCRIRMAPETLRMIESQQIKKGDVLAVSRVAGIQAAKQTPSLIPLCHPLSLSSVSVDFRSESPDTIRVESRVTVTGQTGVEMEALTAVSVAALTIYDMCKSLDRSMTIECVQLEEKSGGSSGHFVRKEVGS